MRTLLWRAVLLLILFLGLSFGSPAAAFVGGQPGIRRACDSPLDRCQKRFEEALRFRQREDEYAAEKATYHESTARSCAGKRWYHLGVLDCLLLVPIVGLFLPFLGFMIIGSLRSIRKPSSLRSIEKEANIADVG